MKKMINRILLLIVSLIVILLFMGAPQPALASRPLLFQRDLMSPDEEERGMAVRSKSARGKHG
ncbi:unnamed protein product [Linum tenue]|uniref:Uncharacterized protein n=1 Tax=Linum tenue TaxID=586396 RepID=A0AAV0NJU7_9ROSI|nr:unnamed protein product [Linum tenue]